MFKYAILGSAVLALASCGGSQPPQDEYFDSINPSSPQLQAAEERLRRAEIAGRGNTPAPSNDIIDTNITTASATGTDPLVPLAPEDRTVISDSQDFVAVQQRETIETDAAKLAELADSYKVFTPEALPERPNSLNLVAFAQDNLNQTVGRKKNPRTRAAYEEASRNFCADYVDQDLAQITFLNQGGPKKDPLLLDADGDGFACGWTPNTYLAQVASAKERARREAEAAAARKRAEELAAQEASLESTDDLAAEALAAVTD